MSYKFHLQEDVDKAVKAARAAFEFGSAWRSLDASRRGLLLYKVRTKLLVNRNKLISHIFCTARGFDRGKCK
jgi:acyl-CoA reductase-like NAD-dependent aldehyde dehydrogenase